MRERRFVSRQTSQTRFIKSWCFDEADECHAPSRGGGVVRSLRLLAGPVVGGIAFAAPSYLGPTNMGSRLVIHCPNCAVRLNLETAEPGTSFPCPKCVGLVFFPHF